MSSPVTELLAALGDAFGRVGARWYLFGAQAAILHGAARLTGDVDVTVDLAGHAVDDLVGVLRGLGFEPRIEDADAFAARTRVLPVVHRASGLPVDIVLAGPGLEELFLERAEQRTVEHVRVWVARMEDVVAMKILAGRPKDLEDAAAMLATHAGDTDTKLIRATLRLLEQALDRRDLRPQFDRLLRRARGKKR
jgi:hypothetical protein